MKGYWVVRALIVCLLVVLVVEGATKTIYNDSIQPPFQDWSYGGSYSLNAGSGAPIHSGSASISLTPSNYNAVSFACPTSCFDSTYNLKFWINGGSSGNQNIQMVIQAGGTSNYIVAQFPISQCLGGNPIPANSWVQGQCSLSAAGTGGLSRIDFKDFSGSGATLYIDDVSLDNGTAVSSSPPAASSKSGSSSSAVSSKSGSSSSAVSSKSGSSSSAASPKSSSSPSAAPSVVVGPISNNLTGIHAQGNKLVNRQGQEVRLRGINRSGTEFMCAQARGIFDGPSDQTMIDAMKTWGVNSIRVPMNEDCWLSTNGISPTYSGAVYQSAITSYVSLLTNNGFAVILELHCSHEGTQYFAMGQEPMPNQDKTGTFWTGVANAFKNNDRVIFDLFNEPFPENNVWDSTTGWQCWKYGGSSCPSLWYQALGFDQLVTIVRNTGARNLIMIGGLSYSNSLQQWLQYKPNDPLNNLAASWHSYNFNLCKDKSCWDSSVGVVAASVPVITGEIGENDCGGGYITPLMQWLESKGISYLSWTWNTWDCSNGPSLITSYDGTPTNFGSAYKSFLASVGASSPRSKAVVVQDVHLLKSSGVQLLEHSLFSNIIHALKECSWGAGL